VAIFVGEIKQHVFEQFEINFAKSEKIYAENEDGEVIDALQDELEQELTTELYEFMLVNNSDREDIQTAMTALEDHVIAEVNRREGLISSTAQRDVRNVLSEIQAAQHKRNRDIIREIVDHSKKLKVQISKCLQALICVVCRGVIRRVARRQRALQMSLTCVLITFLLVCLLSL